MSEIHTPRARAITCLLGIAAAAVILFAGLLIWPIWREHLAVRALVEAVRAKKIEAPLPGGTTQVEISSLTAAVEGVEEAKAWLVAAAALGRLLDDGAHEVRWQAA
jgi:hypothetical protein